MEVSGASAGKFSQYTLQHTPIYHRVFHMDHELAFVEVHKLITIARDGEFRVHVDGL